MKYMVKSNVEMIKEHLNKYIYNTYIKYLNEKYGKVQGPYIINFDTWEHNKAICRNDEGIYIHHTLEDRYTGLSIKNSYPKFCQEAAFLVYCNCIEHIILHYFINKEYKYSKGYYSMLEDLEKGNSAYAKKTLQFHVESEEELKKIISLLKTLSIDTLST